jgi:hypothetical protein
MPTIIMCQFRLGISEKKPTSYRFLMGLIVLMTAIQTIRTACQWYIVWLGFIHYSNSPDQALDALEIDVTSLSLFVTGSMIDLLTILSVKLIMSRLYESLE